MLAFATRIEQVLSDSALMKNISNVSLFLDVEVEHNFLNSSNLLRGKMDPSNIVVNMGNIWSRGILLFSVI